MEYITIERPGYPRVQIPLEDWARLMDYAHRFTAFQINRKDPKVTMEDRLFAEQLDLIDATLGG